MSSSNAAIYFAFGAAAMLAAGAWMRAHPSASDSGRRFGQGLDDAAAASRESVSNAAAAVKATAADAAAAAKAAAKRASPS